jgi:integrase
MPRHGNNIQRTASGRWQASYRKPDGKEASRTFDRRADAARWRREGLAARDRGDWLDPKAGRVTVRDYGERWRAAQLHHRPTTRRQVETVLRLYVYPHLGEAPMGRVQRSDIQALVKRWEADGASPSTIRDARFKWLRSLFLAAVKDDVIRRSPCTDISLPEVVTERPVPLSAAEVERLASAIDPRLRAMVLAGYGLGLRVSEARGLVRPAVDFLGRQVAIAAQLGPARPYPLVPLKNSRRSPARVVPAPGYVLEALSEHLRRYGTGERGLLFCGARGGPLSVAMVSGPFRKACERAGLGSEVTYHTLRHSYASEMLAQGLSVVEVAELIGDTVAMVERTYGHPTVDFRKRARLAVEAAWTGRGERVAESLRSADAGQAGDLH